MGYQQSALLKIALICECKVKVEGARPPCGAYALSSFYKARNLNTSFVGINTHWLKNEKGGW